MDAISVKRTEERATLTTPLGSSSPSSVENQISELISLIISFSTSVYVTLMLEEYRGFEVLLLMFVVMFIWNELNTPLRDWLANFNDGYAKNTNTPHFRWAVASGLVLDIVSKVIILIVFEYASLLQLNLWKRAGLREREKIAFGITIVLIASALFNYILYVQHVIKMEKKVEQSV